jgi:hypothetical protein
MTSVELSFSVDRDWIDANVQTDMSRVNGVALSTSVLPGDMYIHIANVDFSVIEYKIGLLEYARGLYMAVNRTLSYLASGECHPLDALECLLRFRRYDDLISVQSDLTNAVAQCPASELAAAVRQNYIDVLNVLFSLHPEVRHSADLYKWSFADELGVRALFSEAAICEAELN